MYALPAASCSLRAFSCSRCSLLTDRLRRTCMGSTRAGRDRGLRRDAGSRDARARGLSATEQSWLINQITRRTAERAAAGPAAKVRETALMIGRNPGTQGTVVPAARAPRAPNPLPADPAKPATNVVHGPPAADVPARAEPPSATPDPPAVARSARRAAPRADVSPYRAVFACARNAQDAPEQG